MTVSNTKGDTERFMELFLTHQNAAYNLARWLLRDEAAAEDMVQESYVRAFAAKDRFDGANPKAWLLTIVRNRCYTWLKQNAPTKNNLELDADIFDATAEPELSNSATPEALLIKTEDHKFLQQALNDLPPIFRETLILKELEELSYKEIAVITGVPVGTVMSRLARGRSLLKKSLQKQVAL